MVEYTVSVVGWLDVGVNTHCSFSIMRELPGRVCELNTSTRADYKRPRTMGSSEDKTYEVDEIRDKRKSLKNLGVESSGLKGTVTPTLGNLLSI